MTSLPRMQDFATQSSIIFREQSSSQNSLFPFPWKKFYLQNNIAAAGRRDIKTAARGSREHQRRGSTHTLQVKARSAKLCCLPTRRAHTGAPDVCVDSWTLWLPRLWTSRRQMRGTQMSTRKPQEALGWGVHAELDLPQPCLPRDDQSNVQ